MVADRIRVLFKEIGVGKHAMVQGSVPSAANSATLSKHTHLQSAVREGDAEEYAFEFAVCLLVFLRLADAFLQLLAFLSPLLRLCN